MGSGCSGREAVVREPSLTRIEPYVGAVDDEKRENERSLRRLALDGFSARVDMLIKTFDNSPFDGPSGNSRHWYRRKLARLRSAINKLGCIPPRPWPTPAKEFERNTKVVAKESGRNTEVEDTEVVEHSFYPSGRAVQVRKLCGPIHAAFLKEERLALSDVLQQSLISPVVAIVAQYHLPRQDCCESVPQDPVCIFHQLAALYHDLYVPVG